MRPPAALRIALPLALCAAAGAAQESFLERFDGPRLDRGRWMVSDGWTNGDHQLCGWSVGAVAQRDGALRLRLTADPAAGAPYACAEAQTRGRYGYGTYEARIAPAAASGVVSAFFTYLGPVHGAEHDEIDVEFLGRAPREVQTNLYVDAKGGRERDIPLGAGAPGATRDVAFQWTPDAVRWWVDGELVRETTRADGPLPSPPAKIYLSLWAGAQEDWLGPFRPHALPLAMRVERVAYTAPGDPCPFEGSVACPGAGR